MERTSQLNVGGNMDFYNMLERERLDSKKISKTNAVTSIMGHELPDEDVHVGPSDYVAWLTDRKWAHIRLEGKAFGDVPLNVELKLEVWDSPNSAGVVIDAVRIIKLALNNGIAGQLDGPSSYLMKSPHSQRPDDEAREQTEEFIAANARGKSPVADVAKAPLAGDQGRGIAESSRARALMLPVVSSQPLSIAQVTPFARGVGNEINEYVRSVSPRSLSGAGTGWCVAGAGDQVKRLLALDAVRHRPRPRALRAQRFLGGAPSFLPRSTSPPSTRRRNGSSRPRWPARWSRSSSAGSTRAPSPRRRPRELLERYFPGPTSWSSRRGPGATGQQVAAELEAIYRRLAARRHDPEGDPEVRSRIVERPLIEVDLHMHTDHSPDCATPVEVLLETARDRGLGAIADHRPQRGLRRARGAPDRRARWATSR